MSEHNINGVPGKDYSTWTLNLALCLPNTNLLFLDHVPLRGGVGRKSNPLPYDEKSY